MTSPLSTMQWFDSLSAEDRVRLLHRFIIDNELHAELSVFLQEQHDEYLQDLPF